MQWLIAHPETRFEFFSSTQLHSSEPQSAVSSSQRPKLAMVWHKEFDGKRERIVARWVIEP